MRPSSRELGDALVAGYDYVRLEEYLEVVDKESVDGRCHRCLDSNRRFVNSKPWEYDQVTLTLNHLWRTGCWWWIGREERCKQKLHSEVNSKSGECRDDRRSSVYAVLGVCYTQS